MYMKIYGKWPFVVRHMAMNYILFISRIVLTLNHPSKTYMHVHDIELKDHKMAH